MSTKPGQLHQVHHRLALLKFLNDWGCRNLSKKWHWLAAEDLEDWHATAPGSLGLMQGARTGRDATRFSNLAVVFDDLSLRIAAKKERSGKLVEVSFGPTATAKSLFVLWPQTFPAWDGPMRSAFGYDGSGASYAAFVSDIHAKIAETEALCETRRVDLWALPAKIGRPAYTTVAQLVVEYYWITVTRGVSLPSQTTVAEWASWRDQQST